MTTITVEEQSQVRQEARRILKRYGRKPGNLIPILQKVQGKLGYLPREAMLEIAEFLDIPEMDVYSVVTFYKQLSRCPPHHWIINSDNVGHCRYCGEVRDFGKLLRREQILMSPKSKRGGTKGKRGRHQNMRRRFKMHWLLLIIIPILGIAIYFVLSRIVGENDKKGR